MGGKVPTRGTGASAHGKGKQMTKEEVQKDLPLMLLPELLGRHQSKRSRDTGKRKADSSTAGPGEAPPAIAPEGDRDAGQPTACPVAPDPMCHGKENDGAGASDSEREVSSACKRPRVGRQQKGPSKH